MVTATCSCCQPKLVCVIALWGAIRLAVYKLMKTGHHKSSTVTVCNLQKPAASFSLLHLLLLPITSMVSNESQLWLVQHMFTCCSWHLVACSIFM